MKEFACLYKELDETTKTTLKVDALKRFFRDVPPEDAIWAISFLTGRRPRQIIPVKKLREWSAELAGIPEWLFNECYDIVGDLAEAITLLLPDSGQSTDIPLHTWIEEYLLPLRKAPEDYQKKKIIESWNNMNTQERFVWNKLLGGSFRVGVSGKLVIKAIAEHSGLDEAVISHRLMGNWQPNINFYNSLIAADVKDSDLSRPYPFYLAYQLDKNIEELGDINDWQAEWKWDGIRSQIIKRQGQVFIWSRGEDLINERFPELYDLGFFLPDGTAIDGEILSWRDNRPLPFAELQKRIGRKNLNKKILSEIPAVIVAFDLLEFKYNDIRSIPLRERRGMLAKLLDELGDSRLILSQTVAASSWQELGKIREESRSRLVEGFVLKKFASPYGVGRKKGDWWKWKIDPLTVDAVLIYAQPGHGRRSTLYTDYTFGVWDNDALVPFAKAYSGLTDEEIRQVDSFIKKNTLEKFGPVRTVKPELVFELAFEGIQLSTRHKSGVAVRFPRISRWRHDKTIKDADSLDTIKKLIEHP
jgi:DNA ligase-1